MPIFIFSLDDRRMIEPREQPIGIFDSGIGGLTVASAIRKVLPLESLIYFGDTAHMPYGDKSAGTIRWYSENIVHFLDEMHCKAIVIACNTASSFAADSLNKLFGERIMFVNVIDPVIDYLKLTNQYKHIGIIGTKGTIHSGVYPKRIQDVLPEVLVSDLATPLLAPLIEEGYFNNPVIKTILEDYLLRDRLKGIDCLILACTHYPLIKMQIASILGSSVQVLDSSELIANHLRLKLKSNYLLKETGKQENQFYVSDFTESFQHSTEMFFGDQIQLKLSTLRL